MGVAATEVAGMATVLALIAVVQIAAVQVERVNVPGPNGVSLDAALVLPEGAAKAPSVVALHGCGGPFPARDGQWAVELAKAGHIVLLPDSFGSRGLGSQCGVKEREVTPSGLRRQDAIDAAQWLVKRPGSPPGGVALLGWSNGGATVLATARVAPDLPHDLFRRFAAFYPGCSEDDDPRWKPAAPVMILVGESDDWTPAAPCHDLQARYPDKITLVAYPGAYHDFDAPDRPVKIRGGAATVPGGLVHVGTDEPGRHDALARVPGWLEEARSEPEASNPR
jgi:dienelactone hydrolase